MLLAMILPPDELVSLSEREFDVLTSIAVAEVLSSPSIRKAVARRVLSAAAQLRAVRAIEVKKLEG